MYLIVPVNVSPTRGSMLYVVRDSTYPTFPQLSDHPFWTFLYPEETHRSEDFLPLEEKSEGILMHHLCIFSSKL